MNRAHSSPRWPLTLWLALTLWCSELQWNTGPCVESTARSSCDFNARLTCFRLCVPCAGMVAIDYKGEAAFIQYSLFQQPESSVQLWAVCVILRLGRSLHPIDELCAVALRCACTGAEVYSSCCSARQSWTTVSTAPCPRAFLITKRCAPVSWRGPQGSQRSPTTSPSEPTCRHKCGSGLLTNSPSLARLTRACIVTCACKARVRGFGTDVALTLRW